jgi:hypothetical protein
MATAAMVSACSDHDGARDGVYGLVSSWGANPLSHMHLMMNSR